MHSLIQEVGDRPSYFEFSCIDGTEVTMTSLFIKHLGHPSTSMTFTDHGAESSSLCTKVFVDETQQKTALIDVRYLVSHKTSPAPKNPRCSFN